MLNLKIHTIYIFSENKLFAYSFRHTKKAFIFDLEKKISNKKTYKF